MHWMDWKLMTVTLFEKMATSCWSELSYNQHSQQYSRMSVVTWQSALWQFSMTKSVLMSFKFVRLETWERAGQFSSSRSIWNRAGCRAGLPAGPPKRQRKNGQRGVGQPDPPAAPHGDQGVCTLRGPRLHAVRTNADCCDERVKYMIRLLAVNSRFKKFDLLKQVCLHLWISYYSNDVKIAGVTKI
jgi:hypothetical protein